MKVHRQLSVLAVLLCATACANPSRPSEIVRVRATTSFGFCVGYCRTTLEISSSEVVFVKEGWRGEPPLRQTATLTPSEWNDLVRAVDRARLEALPNVIGCPDCADGGAESVDVLAANWSKAVTFDHGADLPSIRPLLDRVRAIRQRFEP